MHQLCHTYKFERQLKVKTLHYVIRYYTLCMTYTYIRKMNPTKMLMILNTK